MSFSRLLQQFRDSAKTEREKGTAFEQLCIRYFTTEPKFAELYSSVQSFADWAMENGKNANDAGIDLVAVTHHQEVHAIQCKFFDESATIRKADIDSFFTASGQAPFSHRILVATTNLWSENAENSLRDQTPPVTKIDLFSLENSVIDWARYLSSGASLALKPKKSLRPHQQNALTKVELGLSCAERGKLIMACGTGKTFTALKIAETLAGKGKRVLFLVPSLNLVSQTLSEWTQESAIPLHSFAVCSDSDIGKKTQADDNEDAIPQLVHELDYPATTNARDLAKAVKAFHEASHMSVVFSTYHSLETLHLAQKNFGLEGFDLVICDEAHRTTGATLEGESESAFVKIHDAAYIVAEKRLYMTATPRVYGNLAKAKALEESIELCSMDDEELYGKELHVINFSEAVELGLLTDYKVIVLNIHASHVSHRIQALLSDGANQLKVDDAARIVGCWKALTKQDMREDLAFDPQPMKRAVAFCQVIEPNYVAKKNTKHKVSSKQIAGMFQAVVEAYQKEISPDEAQLAHTLICQAEHVDGSMNAKQKEEKLNWLKEETPPDICRILSNVRCLSEGVDVPALDAVLFLTPRNSQVDVVQSVGRVMRNAPGKKRGYVILPVVIPAGQEAHEALEKIESFKVVWQVLQALRSHDDRFDAFINKLDLIGSDPSKMEIISISDALPTLAKKLTPSEKGAKKARGGDKIGTPSSSGSQTEKAPDQQKNFHFETTELERALYASVVKKCGNRQHWEDFAKDIAIIAQTHMDRIRSIILIPDPDSDASDAANARKIVNTAIPAGQTFAAFAHELRDDLNDSISDEEIIEMLSQHLITKPIFDTLFADFAFAQHNPISLAMQGVLDALDEHHLDKETDTLERFYASIRRRIVGIDSPEAKQKIIVELYDKFFRHAFPQMAKRLGIVYTPVEVVDFILHSVNHLLEKEFGQSLGSEGVHIIDPFTGTGTFITRLLQSGLISHERLPQKYREEIHANELVLLAYYIAAINIEACYHAIMRDADAPLAPVDYTPFPGICLTDTFRLEEEDLVSHLLAGNSSRRKKLQKLDIRVILGNPPYSVEKGVTYPQLDQRISDTYAEGSNATNKNALYDSYIRAIRWASDRIGSSGIIGFVSGSGFIEKPAMDQMRKALAAEFSNIHFLNLRGDIRKNMLSKGKAAEGQNVFGSGSMTGVCISFLVKNPAAISHGNIFYHDIGDDLSTEEKLTKIRDFGSIEGIARAHGWQMLAPDAHGDWLSHRDDSFSQHLLLGQKLKKGETAELAIFENYSRGLETARDFWCYNSSKSSVIQNMTQTIHFYNHEVDRFQKEHGEKAKKIQDELVSDFIDTNPQKISWSSSLIPKLVTNKKATFSDESLIVSLYRPFSKQWCYYDRVFNHRVAQMPRIFPDAQAENRVICVSGVGARAGFSVLMSDKIPCLDNIEKSQNFPLYLYDEGEVEDAALALEQGDFLREEGAGAGRRRREAITDAALVRFREAYAAAGEGSSIGKEDIFYYIYGLLHAPDYREKFADNLAKEMPRIPLARDFATFRAFEQAGRQLASLHVGYEGQPPCAEVEVEVSARAPEEPTARFRVEKMKFGDKKDQTTICYNDYITLRKIPLAAYEYVVNGKSAIDWVMERQVVKTDKESQIENDANRYATETVGNPRYPLDLLLRVITVSLETQKIVQQLPRWGS